MRSILTNIVLCLSLLSGAFAVPPAEKVADGGSRKNEFRKEADPAAPPKADGDFAGTYFNSRPVPPMTELNGETLGEQIGRGYWLVEFFSPYCGHCKALAPTWQTLYEFYYTSDPLPASDSTKDTDTSLNSFTRYYSFKFAKLDCIAYGDACGDHDIRSFPTIVLFKDGKELKRSVGANEMKYFSDWIEETLESIKPGSRPHEGVTLPDVGAKGISGSSAQKPLEKGKDSVAGGAGGAKQSKDKDKGASKGPTQGRLDKTVPSKPSETPNPIGISRPLTAESFQQLVTVTGEPWFIKFFAPWCHHCQAMAPNWAEMARAMKGKLNVGEVNCDIEKRLCKEAKVRGYPTIYLFRGGERIEYDGLRGLGDLISFGKKAIAVGDGIVDVDAAAFKKLEETEEVIFLYCYDHATTTEDFQALERLVLSLVGHAKLVKTKDPALFERFKISTWPRLLVSRDGKASYYTGLSPRELRDYRQVLNWMQSVWLPIVPELTAMNAKEIMEGQVVVLGILNRDRGDEFTSARREMKNAALEWMDKETQAFQLERQELRDAKQLRIEEAEDRNDQRALRAAKSIRINMDEIKRKEVGFAWVDAVFWERWIRTTYGVDASEGDRVIINDEDNRRYWDQTITGNPIVASRTSILETIPKVIASPPKITPKSTASSFEHFLRGMHSISFGHPWLAIGVFIGISLTVGCVGRKHFRKNRVFGNTGSYFQLDGKEGILGVGAGANGKVD